MTDADTVDQRPLPFPIGYPLRPKPSKAAVRQSSWHREAPTCEDLAADGRVYAPPAAACFAVLPNYARQVVMQH